MHDDTDDAPPSLAREIVRECAITSLQRFIRDNFGLYAPPGDYLALRRENLRRSLDPSRISRRPK
jgi:hypothetical protein